MAPEPLPLLPDTLAMILKESFFLRFTVKGNRSSRPRTVETTYVWDGGQHLYISGYPGKRDWVASLSVNPSLTVHTVEGPVGYDIPAQARVLRSTAERTPHLLAFLDRWAARPEAPRTLFRILLKAVRLNRALHLPWWGPFWVVRRLFDRMPCVELTFTGSPVQQRSGPPPVTSPRP